MVDIKNEFCLTLNDEDKEKYKILFRCLKDPSKQFNDLLKGFIKLQEDKGSIEIDLSFIYFPKQYDFTNKESSLNKIFKECNILNYYKNKEEKQCSKITKRINFANTIFKKQIEFIRVTFEKRVNFEGAIFLDDANFQGAIFEEDTYEIEDYQQGTLFEGVRFEKEAIFNEAEFKDKAKFFRVKFKDYSSFNKTKFHSKVSFENAISKDLFYFHDVSIGELNLIGFHYEKANFLVLTNIEDNKTLSKKNFKNKDSVRIIKAHFEKQNNITETNDYFVIEQEFYIDLLKKDSTSYSNKKINLISLVFNKYVSNYGTDWVRVLIVMFGFGSLAGFGYSLFDTEDSYRYISFNKEEVVWQYVCIVVSILLYCFNYKKNKLFNFLFFTAIIYYIQAFILYENLQKTTNKIITLINPLSIFNQDFYYIETMKHHQHYFIHINNFENIALYGLLVKGVAIILIYKFIISFRNSTRRK